MFLNKDSKPLTRFATLIVVFLLMLILASILSSISMLITQNLLYVLFTTTFISFGGAILCYNKLFFDSFFNTNLFVLPKNKLWFLWGVLFFIASIPLVEFFSVPNEKDIIIDLCRKASPLSLILLIVNIAILPAIFEEWFFRGIMQKDLSQIFHNDYLGIISTAIIFSLFHMEFNNFIPRLILGLLLGFLFHFSKSLCVNILVHFINNFIVIILAYLFS